jgi:23S rRNA (pseudouridine1915-N3)-methyltransferase
MVRFRIIAVGKTPKGWRQEAYDHYVKLLRPMAKVESVSVRESRPESDSLVDRALDTEADKIIAAIDNSSYKIMLDRTGAEQSSRDLAEKIEAVIQRNSLLEFIIGGPYGLHERVIDASDEVLSLSKMTFPHDLSRIMLIEQLYRAMSILKNLPYPK